MSDRADGTDALAEIGRALIALAESPRPDRLPVVRPAGVVVRPSTTSVEVVRQSADRTLRIEQGRRARRMPYVATAATAAAGYTAWGVGELAAVAAGPLGTLVATSSTAGMCAATLGVLRLTYRDRIAPQWRRRWWVAGAAASWWVTTATAVGADSWAMTACLALGAAAASARWLREHEVPCPDEESSVIEAEIVDEREPEDEGDLADELARRFATNVVPKILPSGSMLTDRIDLPRAIRWTIRTPPGSITFGTMYERRARIAAGMNLPLAKVLMEPSDEDEGHALLTVITRDLLAAGISYTGPRYKDGRIPLGPFADGSGEAEYIAVDQVGCRNGMATGEPGSGKSAFLEAVALGLKSSGVWRVWFGDGDPEGGSSPLLNEIADDNPAAGPEQVLQQLEALEALLPVRGLLKATLTEGPDGEPVPITDPIRQRPVREMRPSRAYPAIMWIIDELHRLTSDPWLIERGFVKRLERLVRIGRKYGIVLLTGSQSLLAPDYGNSTPLRGYLAARNLFAFRNGNKNEKTVVSGLEISPSTLPPGGGYAFAAGAGRLAMTRVAWARDMTPFAAGLPDSPFDPDSALAVAPFRPATPRDRAAAYAEQIVRLQQWRAQQDGANSAAAQDVPAGPAQLPRITGGLGTDLAGLTVPPALTAENVIPIRRQAAPARRQALDEGPDLDALNATVRAVYDALHEGHRRTGAIAEATELLKPSVSKALSTLADLGLASKLAHGEYEPTGPAPAQIG